MTAERRIHEVWSLRDLFHRLLDAATILLALVWTLHQRGLAWSDVPLLAGITAVVVYYLVGEATGVYRSWRGVSLDREVLCALLTMAIAAPILLTLGVWSGYAADFSRAVLFTWMIAACTIFVATRTVLRGIVRFLRVRGFNTKRYAIVGINDLGFTLARNIENSPELGLHWIGFYDDRPAERLPKIPADIGRQTGTIEELVHQTQHNLIDTIYVTLPMRAEIRIKNILDKLSDSTASVYIVPDFFVFQLLHSRWTSINGVPAVSVFENPFYGIDGLLKRAMDLILATLFLVLGAVPMLGIALAIKLTSRGPVFFKQKRYGLDGRAFYVWKFRSMKTVETGSEYKQATKNDPRVTPLGAFLRKTSLDEVPQLFNVLEGSMSLVGPRPHPNLQNESFRTRIQGYMLRHKVKPGITGLAQVNGFRGETETLDKMEKRIEFDHRYIREWSLWMDLKILFKTFFVVLKRQNAY
ncbi:MAG TPA: undecaprenyl-phosphate glucose phosphotransferase [Pirellulales bacterium]|jgi:putative colanic acid biosynthesis UDP-glucose lipid carrier transferase|nr:undecaprenyl-phosphate glucose phosphotransferase [Pirellulales bacterium]